MLDHMAGRVLFKLLGVFVKIVLLLLIITFPFAVMRFGWLWLRAGLSSELPPPIVTLIGGALALALLFLAAASGVAFSRWRRRGTGTHGTARWGVGESLRGHAKGLPLAWHGKSLLRLAGEGHVLTFGPTGSGKSRSAAIPALLEHPGSVLAVDIKGELAAVTGRARREAGCRVEMLDPFGLASPYSAAWNPLDLVDLTGFDWLDDANLIAEALITPHAHTSGDAMYWLTEGRAWLAGVILHVCASEPGESRTLLRVRELLTLSGADLKALLASMMGSTACDGLVSRAASRLLGKSEREAAGVRSSATNATHWLDSPQLRRCLTRSSFDLLDLKRELMSVFVICPQERIDTNRGWIRLLCAQGLLALTKTRQPQPERVLYLMDELANLGRLEAVERAVTLARGYGGNLWMLVQDLPQLRSAYPTWESLVANSTIQVLGATDHTTADYVSKLTGQTTVRAAGSSRGRGRSGPILQGGIGGLSGNRSQSTQEVARPLMTPDEVRRLSHDELLIFPPRELPVRARPVDYLRDWPTKADPNPYYLKESHAG